MIVKKSDPALTLDRLRAILTEEFGFRPHPLREQWPTTLVWNETCTCCGRDYNVFVYERSYGWSGKRVFGLQTSDWHSPLWRKYRKTTEDRFRKAIQKLIDREYNA